MAESNEESILIDELNKWYSLDNFDQDYSVRRFPHLEKFFGENYIEPARVRRVIDAFKFKSSNKGEISRSLLIVRIKENEDHDLSDACYKQVMEECNGALVDFDFEKFKEKFPQYASEIENSYYLQKTKGLGKILENNQCITLLKSIVPELSEEEFDQKLTKLKICDVKNSVYDYKRLVRINEFTKEELISMITNTLDFEKLFDNSRVGFSSKDILFVENMASILNDYLDYIPDELLKGFYGQLSKKLDRDQAIVEQSRTFEDFRELDKVESILVNEAIIEDEVPDAEDIAHFNELLSIAKEFNFEQLNQLENFEGAIENYIENKDNPEYNDERFELNVNIFKVYLSKCEKPEDLLNGTISKCLALMNCNAISEDKKNKLKNVFEEEYQKRFAKNNESRIQEIKSKNPDLISKITENHSLSEEEYKMATQLACLERASTGIFDEKYINCILKYNMENQISDTQNTTLLKRVFEDKTMDSLKKSGITDYIVVTRNAKCYQDDNGLTTFGEHNTSGLITLNEKIFESKKTIVSILNAALHETQHAVQFREIEHAKSGDTTDFLLYDMEKEAQIRSHYGNQYYKENYEKIEYETDANIAASKKTMEYLQELGIDDKAIVDAMQAALFANLVLREDNKRKAPKDTNLPLFTSPDILYQKLIKEKPELLQEFKPALMEFSSETGMRKGNLAILQEYDEWCVQNHIDDSQVVVNEFSDGQNMYYGDAEKTDNQRIAELYAHIIRNDAMIDDKDVINDMLLLPTLNLNNPRLGKLRDKVIEGEIFYTIDRWKRIFTPFDIDDDLLNKGFSALEKFSETSENEELKQKISQKLQEAKEANIWPEFSERTEESEGTKVTFWSDLKLLRTVASVISMHEISEGRQVINEALKEDKDKVGEITDER